MADRVYPSAKPSNGGAASNAAAPSFAAPKPQPYGAARPPYRPRLPPPKRHRHRRSCCCVCCLWLTLLLLALVFLAAIAAGVFYVLYRPHRPTFSVSSLSLSTLNLTRDNALTARLDLAVTARNPNRKLVFLYGPTSVAAATTPGGALLGVGSFPAFTHEAKNTTVLHAVVSSSGETVDPSAAGDLRKRTIPLEIRLETTAGVKIGSFKSKRIGIRVTCLGISVSAPKGKHPAVAASSDTSCTVKIRIKIWKWTV